MIGRFVGAGVAGMLIAGAYVDYGKLVDALAPWKAIVRDAAQKYGIDPALLASVLWVESRFNPDAVGSAGEHGMGQFKKIAADDVRVNYENLKTDPSLQIKAAAMLLRLNADRLGGNMIGSVRAYNVGIGTVKEDVLSGWDYFYKVGLLWFVGVVNEKLGSQYWRD